MSHLQWWQQKLSGAAFSEWRSWNWTNSKRFALKNVLQQSLKHWLRPDRFSLEFCLIKQLWFFLYKAYFLAWAPYDLVGIIKMSILCRLRISLLIALDEPVLFYAAFFSCFNFFSVVNLFVSLHNNYFILFI